MTDAAHNHTPQPQLATHSGKGKIKAKTANTIQAKPAAKGKEEKQRTVRKTLPNGEVKEVAVKAFTPGDGVQLFWDVFGMTIPERNAWFKQNPEYNANRKELGRRFNAVVEDGKPLDRRFVNKVRNLPLAATLGVAVSAFTVGMCGWMGYDKYQDYKASEGL